MPDDSAEGIASALATRIAADKAAAIEAKAAEIAAAEEEAQAKLDAAAERQAKIPAGEEVDELPEEDAQLCHTVQCNSCRSVFQVGRGGAATRVAALCV